MHGTRAIGVFALSLALADSAGAQEVTPSPVEQFAQICGTTDEGMPRLPGEDLAADQAPAIFAFDLKRATSSRVVKIGDRYAMRAVMPSSADPANVIIVKCRLAFGSESFSDEVQKMATTLSAKPSDYGDPGALVVFRVGVTSFDVRKGTDQWVSIDKMDFLIGNVDPKYINKGAKPVPGPVAQ